ncbi:MAG: 2-amino-4-hydroxy-6-hydroxymethyldihydropteridine diphosphokinase [Magnetococcales bacterium]|nr:2-amino-4-hydroxy-6-hydroxymethyldihydropteridine diphosphokinase [Magnetococcales bacterium]
MIDSSSNSVASFAWIGLGANLGDPASALRRALRALDDLPGVRLDAASPLFRTQPVGGPSQPWYYNAAARIVTTHDPLTLLHQLQRLESLAGRDRSRETRWGPRLLDLDLLMHGAAILSLPELILPHPRMHLRRFVLTPLAAIDPGLIHPILASSIDTLLAAVEDPAHVEPLGPFRTPL